jgi:Fe-S-cluster containining protein
MLTLLPADWNIYRFSSIILFYIAKPQLQEATAIKSNKRISKLLKIRCSQCGTCCTEPIIEVTHHDLKRLVKHTGKSADKLIKLYTRSDFVEVDESDMISMSYGSRKIALRKKSDGACIFLSDKKQCSAYEGRPMSCRIFPIDVILDEDNNVTDLELSDVIQDKFIKCKHHYGKPVSFKNFILMAEQCGTEKVKKAERLTCFSSWVLKLPDRHISQSLKIRKGVIIDDEKRENFYHAAPELPAYWMRNRRRPKGGRQKTSI